MKPSATNKNTDSRERLALAALLAGVTLAVYWPALHTGFLYLDDNVNVTANPFIQQGLSFHGLLWAFTTTLSELWNPLLWLSYMLDFQVFGLDPIGFHFTNLAIHAANAALVFWILQKMTGRKWQSAFAAAFFSLHPLRVESVAWITERKDVLYAFFFLCSLGAYHAWTRKPTLLRYGALVVAFACALMSKGLAVTLPVILLALDYWPLGRLNRASLRDRIVEKLPLLALSAAVGALNLAARRFLLSSEAAVPLWRRIASVPVFYARYLEMIFWPKELPLYYPRPAAALDAGIVLGSLAVLALLSTAAWRSRRGCPAFLTGWLWFLIALLPVSGVLEGIISNRYSYVPQIGIAVALAWAGGELARSRIWPTKAIAAAGLAILFLCTALTRRELGYWSDQKRLYERALAAAPENELFHNFYGVYLAQHGEPAAAEAQLRQAAAIKPSYADAHNNLGFLFENEGRRAEALAEYREAIRLSPGHPEATRNLDRLLRAQPSRSSHR